MTTMSLPTSHARWQRRRARRGAHAATPWVSLVLALVLASTGCTDNEPAVPPPSAPATTARSGPGPVDLRLRPVRLAYADAIAFVLPETAAQALCQALSPTQWREAFGEEAGREVHASAAQAACVVTSGTVRITLSMTVFEIDSILADDERIAGRRVRVRPPSHPGSSVAAAAAVVPIGEQGVPTQQRLNAEPVLSVHARTQWPHTHSDLPGLVRRLLAAVLPRLTPAGPATPVSDPVGRLAYMPIDPIAGVPLFDLPRTVQSLVLCTAVLRAGGRAPTSEEVHVNSVGECQVDGWGKPIFAGIDRFAGPVTGEFTIAGHPAQLGSRGVEIQLLTMVTDRRTSYLNLRLERHDLDPTQLRAWAEQVAAPLLTT